jgi:hypothetical protein
MITYEEIKDEFGSVIKATDEAGNILWIPTDPANSDYQAYLNKDNPDYGKPAKL